MRVRLFEIGGPHGGVVVDKFPATLTMGEDGAVRDEFVSGKPLCRLEDCDGQILFESLDSDETPAVNELELQFGPLMPGDRLSVGSHCYVVSYERTCTSPPPEPRYRIYDE